MYIMQVMTAVLVLVVLETAVNKRNSISKAQAPLAIGFAVFCAHAVLLPIDGCSINPARSLGPAIIAGVWPGTFWVFIVGAFPFAKHAPIVGPKMREGLHTYVTSTFVSVQDHSWGPLLLFPSTSSSSLTLKKWPHHQTL